MEKRSAKAIPFIAYDERRNVYEVNPEALEFLDSLGTRHIGVTTTVGKYRTGKSSFTNQGLLRCEPGSGFPVGGTINACTKGVWIYTDALKGKKCDCIVVLDTEGIGALDSTSNHDARIFSLGLLLSSYFILNSMHSIDEMALSHLSLVTRVSECICLSMEESADDIFPDFLWLLRDFTLTLASEDHKTIITEKQYLENALQQRPSAPPEKNEIRATILEFFRNRTCHTLPPPYANAKDLQDMSKLSFSQFPREFAEKLDAVRRDILANVRVKTAGGQPLTGHLLGTFAKHLVKAINAGHAPVLKDAWSAMAAERMRDAYDQASQLLESAIAEARRTCDTCAALADRTNEAVEEAQRVFKEGCGRQRPDDLQRRFDMLVMQRRADAFRQAIAMNLEQLEYRLENECSDLNEAHSLLDRVRRDTKSALNAGALFVDLWESSISSRLWPIVKACASGGAGRSKEMAERLEAAERNCAIAQKRLEELQQTLETERERAGQTIGDCEKATDAMRIEVDTLQEQLDAAQRRVNDLEMQVSELEQRPVSRAMEEEEEEEKRQLREELAMEKARAGDLDSRLARAQEEHARQIEELGERVESAREDLERHKQVLVRQSEEARAEAEKYRTALETLRMAHKETLDSTQKQHSLLMADKDEAMARLHEEQSKKQSEFIHTVRQLEREKARAETHAESLKRRLDECEGESERKRLRTENSEARIEAARNSTKAELLEKRCGTLEETVKSQREEISLLQRNLESERTKARVMYAERQIKAATTGV